MAMSHGKPQAAIGVPMPQTTKVFEDRENAGDWRVEWIDDDRRPMLTLLLQGENRELVVW